MFKIQDENGKTYNEVKRPTVVYDAQSTVLLKIGDWEEMVDYFDYVQKSYRNNGFDVIADGIHIMELPKQQEEIDKVFQICDYIGTLHKRAFH